MTYYLHAEDRHLVNLGTFEARRPFLALRNIRRSLGMKSGKSGGGDNYDVEMFSRDRYFLLEDGVLKVVYHAQPPFRGAIKILDRNNSEGEFHVAEGMIPWEEASEICTKQFLQNAEPGSFQLFSNILSRDKAGYYYLCTFHETVVPNTGEYDRYFYRLDLDSRSSLGPVLIKKEDLLSSPSITPPLPPK